MFAYLFGQTFRLKNVESFKITFKLRLTIQTIHTLRNNTNYTYTYIQIV